MNAKTLSILAAVTILIALVAVFAYTRRSVPTGPAESTDVLFAGLSDRVNDVTGIEVVGDGVAVHIERVGSDWGVTEKGGFPVEFEKVKKAIMNVAELEIVEPKTSRVENHERLGLNDPGEGSESKRVTLTDAAGEPVASLIIGRRAEGSASRHYVRRAGEDQAWLVAGDLDADGDVLSWIDTQVVLFSRERVKSVTISHPDGEELLILRDSKDDRDYLVDDVPEGSELRFPGVAGTIGSGASFLRGEDVSPETDVLCDDEGDTIAEYRTFDGLLVTIWTCTTGDGQVWARFHAEAEDVQAAADPALEEATEGDEPDVEAEAARFNDALDGWRYKLTAAQATNLRKRMADLTKPIEPAEPEPSQPDATPAGAEPVTPAAPPG